MQNGPEDHRAGPAQTVRLVTVEQDSDATVSIVCGAWEPCAPIRSAIYLPDTPMHMETSKYTANECDCAPSAPSRRFLAPPRMMLP